jgi:phosphate starvation-inducible PhoH-like protein
MPAHQKPFGQTIITDYKGNRIQAKTHGQSELIKAIDKYDILFVNGPAGTGKTFLATCKAIRFLQENVYERIVLTRPAVESGEELGFLPGSLDDKIAPYMKPLFDSIVKIKGKKADPLNQNQPQQSHPINVTKRRSKKQQAQGDKKSSEIEDWSKKVEVAPLAYMRGSTFDNSFIIMDEAQNVTPSQMKLFLTRLGNNSKVIITGDASQSDLDRRIGSGFTHAQKLLNDVDGIGFVTMDENDIVRHKLVKDIILKYDKEDSYRNNVYSNRD